MFEEFLSTAPSEASYDSVRQSVVILMGTLAKHLDIDNPKVKPIVARLIEALSTPSEEVKAFAELKNVISRDIWGIPEILIGIWSSFLLDELDIF